MWKLNPAAVSGMVQTSYHVIADDDRAIDTSLPKASNFCSKGWYKQVNNNKCNYT